MSDAVDGPTLARWLRDGERVWLVHAADPASFRGGHLPGAICFLDVEQACSVLRPGDRVVVYDDQEGDVGAASEWVTELRQRGYRRSSWLRGGLRGWLAGGGSLEGSSGQVAAHPGSGYRRGEAEDRE